MHLPLIRHLDGMMTQRGQCYEPAVGFCGQRGVWFPISLDSSVFTAWNSLHSPSQLGNLHS